MNTNSTASWIHRAPPFFLLSLWIFMLAGQPAAEPAPRVEWTTQTGARVYSSPVVAELAETPGLEILLTSSDDRSVSCFSASQKVLWTYDDFTLRLSSTPTVADLDKDGKLEILITTRQEGVTCLNADGSLRWKVPVKSDIAWGSAAVADVDNDGTLEICWAALSGLVECHAPDGSKKWDFTMPSSGSYAAPAVGDVNADGFAEVITCDSSAVFCLDYKGQEQWRFQGMATFNAGPVIAHIRDDTPYDILALSSDGVLWCLDSKTGNALWNHRTFRIRTDTTIAVADIDGDNRNEIFYGDGLGNLYCIAGGGRERWSFQAMDWIESAPAIGDVDGDDQMEVLLCSADGNLYCLSAKGETEWTFSTGKRIGASPTLCDYDLDNKTEILFPSHNGLLYCLTFDAEWNPKKMPWPFRRYDFQHTAFVPTR
ncbi:MAG TPA: FG-GAP-like repeat-containing protein [bacterium]|nr:FG-GAP-like repeat-containing protein [bacterium]HQO33376.1 FG-GAP-like repeat-containing protein [bacterium]